MVTRAAREGIVGFQPRELLIIIIFCALVLGVPFFRLLPPEIQQVLPARAVVAATGGPYVQKAVKDRQDRMQKQLALLARALSNCSTVAVCDPASLAWPIYHAAGRLSKDSRLARESSALDAQVRNSGPTMGPHPSGRDRPRNDPRSYRSKHAKSWFAALVTQTSH